MGNAQWIGLNLKNSTGVQFKILAVKLSWGKTYKDPNDKDSEIPPGSLVGTIIKPGSSFTLNACGKNGTSSGTEGTIAIGHETTSNISIYWTVPWSGANVLTPTVSEGPYWANIISHVPNDGPIGNITVEFGDKKV